MCVLDCLCSEYEGRIAELQEQFGREHADKTRLQQELDQLQGDWDDQLNEAQVSYKFSVCVCVCVCVCMCLHAYLRACVCACCCFG